MMTNLFVEKYLALKITGIDAMDFLHRLTSQHIKKMGDGEIQPGALLQPSSMILNLFFIERKSNGEFILHTEALKMESLKANLEKLHFAEDLVFEEGPSTLVQNSKTLNEVERVENELVKEGVDFTEKNLIQELPLNSFVHRDKGCYPGQETVERVFTYGKMAKKLVIIELGEENQLKAGDSVSKNGEAVGKITSVGLTKAFAFVKKPFYEAETRLDQGGVKLFSDN
jgi:folate-binding protein YgfZ